MILDRLDRRGRRALAAAVRAGEVCELPAGVCSTVPMDELVPFFVDVADEGYRRWMAPGRAAPGAADIAVSVVIPASRGAPIGLAALAAQDVEVEVLVLANGAYAGAPEAGTGGGPANTRVLSVPWEGHGRTRQRGVEAARHRYVLFTVDDALPLGAGFLRALVTALEDGGYDAVYARQVPWPDADAVTRARLRAWTPPPGAPPGSHAPGPHLDHVAALHRRDALLADPLDDTPIAEDWLWGRRHHVGYVPGAPVAHSHPRRLRALYARTRALHEVFVRHGEAPTVPSIGALARALPGVVGPDLRGALGELLGQYAGGRAALR